MDKAFLEIQIESVISDLTFHKSSLAANQATLEGVKSLAESDLKTTLTKEATEQVAWYRSRIEHDINMLDVFYTARDLSDNV